MITLSSSCCICFATKANPPINGTNSNGKLELERGPLTILDEREVANRHDSRQSPCSLIVTSNSFMRKGVIALSIGPRIQMQTSFPDRSILPVLLSMSNLASPPYTVIGCAVDLDRGCLIVRTALLKYLPLYLNTHHRNQLVSEAGRPSGMHVGCWADSRFDKG
jgi:hypothetical protein